MTAHQTNDHVVILLPFSSSHLFFAKCLQVIYIYKQCWEKLYVHTGEIVASKSYAHVFFFGASAPDMLKD